MNVEPNNNQRRESGGPVEERDFREEGKATFDDEDVYEIKDNPVDGEVSTDVDA